MKRLEAERLKPLALSLEERGRFALYLSGISTLLLFLLPTAYRLLPAIMPPLPM
jgi:hypothetical protein